MKRSSKLMTMFLALCLVVTSVTCFPSTALAKNPLSIQQVKKLAKKQVKGGTILDVERDYEKGVLVYDVEMLKGKKEYDLTYRASDSKLISYGWEIQSWYIARGKGKVISVNKCKNLAKKEVPGGQILSVVRKRSGGVDIYKVKAKKGNKKYEMEFHARTGKLLEYDWELAKKDNHSTDKYIGEAKAKQIALKEAGGGAVIKIEFEMDHGIPVYEVEVIYNELEYDIEIHAKTGAVLDVDVDYLYE